MRHAIVFCLGVLLLGLMIGPAAPQDSGDIKPEVSQQIADLEKKIAKLDPKAKPSAETLNLYSQLGRLYLETNQIEKAVKVYSKGGKIAGQLSGYSWYIPNAASQVHYQTWLSTRLLARGCVYIQPQLG